MNLHYVIFIATNLCYKKNNLCYLLLGVLKSYAQFRVYMTWLFFNV